MLNSTTCPNCGANLDEAMNIRRPFVRCEYCDSVFTNSFYKKSEKPDSAQTISELGQLGVDIAPARDNKSVRKLKAITAAYFIIIFGIIALSSLSRKFSDNGRPYRSCVGMNIELAGDDGGTAPEYFTDRVIWPSA